MKRKLSQPERSEPAFESVRPSKVPKVLQTGAFFQSLDKEDDTPIQVPVGASKANLNVRSTHQLSLLLNSLRFWGVASIPDRVLALLINRTVPLTAAVANNFKVCFPILEPLHSITHQFRIGGPIDNAIAQDSVDIFEFYRRRGFQFADFHSELAAEKGSKRCLKWLHISGTSLSIATFEKAAKSNDLGTIRYLHEVGCPRSQNVLDLIMSSDSLECFSYALEHFLAPGTQATFLAVHVVFYLKKLRLEECMNFAIEHGCPYDPAILAKFR